ncbi:hypothetical protein H0H87_002098 [Tephrocybe sp. NHM501043]|nr:hypothetical protein H0H87_002098 [Tephrocybe sp. NHM501043]
MAASMPFPNEVDGGVIVRDKAGNPTGVLLDNAQELLKQPKLTEADLNVHAIGDRANGIVLDAFEASLKGAKMTALRPRLEHAQIMTLADMKRLGRLGVIASVQPTHVYGEWLPMLSKLLTNHLQHQ